METIMSILNRCDPRTREHQLRVSKLSASIASAMGLPTEQVDNIRTIGLIHDIGKICLPPELATNTDELSPSELFIVRRHPQVGFDILDGLGFPEVVQKSVLQHHEHIDGSGYPDGLVGGQILIEAKIVSVADVVDAMTSNRPYNRSLNLVDAISEVTNNQGRYFDPVVVSAYLNIYSDTNFHQRTTTTRFRSRRPSC